MGYFCYKTITFSLTKLFNHLSHNSFPYQLSFIQPYGKNGYEVTILFINTFQASIFLDISFNSSMLSQYKLHHKPNLELFARLIASSKLLALITGATGQNTSSSNTLIPGFTSLSTVGGNKFESLKIAFHQVNKIAQLFIESFI
jgi:hypothetical protein